MQRDRHDTDFTAFYECLVYSVPQSLGLLSDDSHDTEGHRFIYVGAIFLQSCSKATVTNSKTILTVIPAHYWLAFTCSL
jgi:hypothetical protein